MSAQVTLSVGWWAVPLAITALSVGWAFAVPARPMRGDYSFPDIMPLFRLGAAIIGSLVAWLIWAIIA